ncbi:MAG: RNA ligase [Candidatus Bilamarchaeaceae archaeon]
MEELKSSLKRRILEAIGKGKVEQKDGIYRFSEAIGDEIPRGTVVIGNRVVYGYPKIRRIFSLESGVKRNFDGGKELWVEEKIDGYNLRAVYEGGKLYCISRGGFLDYFSTEKMAGFPEISWFFSKCPRMVLHFEMVGNTPYTQPARGFDVKYYVFDIGDGKNQFLDCGERRRICEKHGLNAVPLLAHMKSPDVKKLKEIAVSIDKGGGEGMVMRQENPRKVLKFVVPSSDIRDLAQNSAQIFDMPAGFMKQRVFRSAVSVAELGLDKAAYGRKLGEAMHSGLHACIRGGGEVAEDFEVMVKSMETWKKITSHMPREVEIRVDYTVREKGGFRIGFKKVYKQGSRQVRRAIEGYSQAD